MSLRAKATIGSRPYVRAYPVQYPNCNINNADINGDDSINALDIEPFLNLLFQ